jgi:diguanylate cyclase (GGDEF)-like protein
LARLASAALGEAALLLPPAAQDDEDAEPSVGPAPDRELGGPGLRILLLANPKGIIEPAVIDDLARDAMGSELRSVLRVDARAAAVLPLGGSGQRTAGALCVLDSAPRAWSESEVAVLRDLAASLSTEIDLRRDALQDRLTGLPNRALFLDRLDHALARAKRHKNFRFAVIAVELDRLKLVNDSLGRQVGDELLASVARRLESCVRAEDMVARLGGDEFAVLLESLSSDADGGRVAERIQRALAAPLALGGHEVFASASMGVVLSSSGLESPADIVQSAGIAVSRAKAAGRARYAMFDGAMQTRALRRLTAETDLHRAVERREFVVYYQPLVTLSTGRITELEALVRWRHPERGLVPPLEFIPLAEETGLVLPIGSWVLAEACRQTREWQRRFPREAPLAISVNLSVKQFGQPGFVAHVSETIARCGLDPHSLKLEITESFAIDDATRTLTMLEELKALGVRIYLDDFGTGYSSLGYLHQLPLDAIKIDRSFVTRMETGATHLQLVRTVRTLAQNIGVSAVAEGVETTAQLQTLRDLGCEYAQGYLFSKPVAPEEVEQLLATDPTW